MRLNVVLQKLRCIEKTIRVASESKPLLSKWDFESYADRVHEAIGCIEYLKDAHPEVLTQLEEEEDAEV